MVAVSCVVPTYKRIDQTIKTIELLLASDGVHSVFELEVIVSDSTPDETMKEAAHRAFGDRVRYTRPDHEGIAANKNAGAKAASHSILIFCDSDMEVEKNTLLNAVDHLKTHEKTALVGGFVMWKGGPNDKLKDRPRSEDRMVRKGGTMFIEALYSRFVATYRDIFWLVGGYDEGVFNMRGEGSDLSVRYWRAGFPLAFDESIIVHHVHDVPDAAAVRVNHSEWGIARDYLLLGYKYSMFEKDAKSFASTVSMNFAPLGSLAPYRLLQGIGKNLEVIVAAKQKLDVFRVTDTPVYDFKFLEIFSNTQQFELCVQKATEMLHQTRTSVFI